MIKDDLSHWPPTYQDFAPSRAPREPRQREPKRPFNDLDREELIAASEMAAGYMRDSDAKLADEWDPLRRAGLQSNIRKQHFFIERVARRLAYLELVQPSWIARVIDRVLSGLSADELATLNERWPGQ